MGTTEGLKQIHQFLFQDDFDFAGKIRDADWPKVGKEEYLYAMERSPINDLDLAN